MKGLPPSASWGFLGKETRDTIEQAKEELQILEEQQPNRFNYLKLELKSFISFLESQNLLLSHNNCRNMVARAADSTSLSVSSSATTQASSTCKKRKKLNSEDQEVKKDGGEALKQKFQRVDRIDEVVERARACLDKIQQFKTSFS